MVIIQPEINFEIKFTLKKIKKDFFEIRMSWKSRVWTILHFLTIMFIFTTYFS
jgi:hypothetical protein